MYLVQFGSSGTRENLNIRTLGESKENKGLQLWKNVRERMRFFFFFNFYAEGPTVT